MRSLTTTLLLAALLLAVVAPASAVPVAGTTSQHAGRYRSQRLPSNAVSFSLARGRVSRLSIPWVAACRTEAGHRRDAPLLDRILIVDALPLRAGRFVAEGSYAFPPGLDQQADVAFTLKGVLRGGRASGTLELNAAITLNGSFPADTCAPARVIRWHAVSGRRARSLAAPARNRPRGHYDGIVAYARTDASGASAIFRTIPDRRRRTTQVTRPPGGATDTAPTLWDIPSALAFQRTTGGVGQIHIADPLSSFQFSTPFPDGRDTDFAQGAGDPALDPVDTTIAFSVGRGADCTIWLMNNTGDDQRRLTDHGGSPGCDAAPAWSPDGRRLAFRRTVTDASGATLSTKVLVVSPRGGSPRPLRLGSAPPSGFTWAPGRKIAYVAAGALSVVNPDGTGRRTLLRDRRLQGRPAWAPLRDRIAVAVRRGDGSRDLLAVPVAGGAPTTITDTPGVSEDSPTWSFPLPPPVGGGEPGPSVHVQSQSARPHKRRRRRT